MALASMSGALLVLGECLDYRLLDCFRLFSLCSVLACICVYACLCVACPFFSADYVCTRCAVQCCVALLRGSWCIGVLVCVVVCVLRYFLQLSRAADYLFVRPRKLPFCLFFA